MLQWQKNFDQEQIMTFVFEALTRKCSIFNLHDRFWATSSNKSEMNQAMFREQHLQFRCFRVCSRGVV